MDPQGARENRGVCSIWGEGGVMLVFFPKGPLVFGRFLHVVRDQGKVRGLVENFDRDILVFGRGSLSGSCK